MASYLLSFPCLGSCRRAGTPRPGRQFRARDQNLHYWGFCTIGENARGAPGGWSTPPFASPSRHHAGFSPQPRPRLQPRPFSNCPLPPIRWNLELGIWNFQSATPVPLKYANRTQLVIDSPNPPQTPLTSYNTPIRPPPDNPTALPREILDRVERVFDYHRHSKL